MAWVGGEQRVLAHSKSFTGTQYSVGATSRVSSPTRRRRRGERDAKPERQADNALLSWRVGQGGMQFSNLQSSLNLSSRISDVEMKEVIKQRGGNQIAGLHFAATQGDYSTILRIVKAEGPSNIQLNQLDANNLTPLMYAVLADSKQALEILINSGCRKEQTDTEGRTATHYAAFFGRQKALKFLVDTASDWAARDQYGRTPLHWACASRSTNCLQYLLQHARMVMGDISPQDSEGMTPLHCAAHLCKPRHIAILDEAECDFSAVDIEGKTALHWTVANPDPTAFYALLQAHPPLLNRQDIYGSTILHLAAEHGSVIITQAILGRRNMEFDINAKNGLEQTALHVASKGGHSDIVKLLLDNNANDSLVDKTMLSPLHYAIESNSLDCVQCFVERPNVANVPDANGRNPIMWAAAKDQHQILQLILTNKKLKGDVNLTDENGCTALHSACGSGAHNCVSVLLSNDAHPNVVDNWQQTGLFAAAEGGHAECILKLVASGCNADILAVDKMAAIHRAVLANQLESVRALVLSAVNLDIRDSNGDSPIHLAVLGDFTQILTLLLDNLADANIQNLRGMTALHYAASEGKAEATAVLLDHQAYPNFMDSSTERCTPLDYAKLYNQTDCVDILVAAGATTRADIVVLAATMIQSAYRGYKACKLRVELGKQQKAAYVITAHAKGYLQRKSFKKMLTRHRATITIQSYVRGHLQRKVFKTQLVKYKEKMRRVKLMEDFSKRIISDKEAQLLKTFTTSLSVSRPVSQLSTRKGSAITGTHRTIIDTEEMIRQRKQRLEEALKMREIQQKIQNDWAAFREAERQRRVDKANKQEADRLAAILAESKARRNYHNTKYSQTNTVRSYIMAVIAIQKWYKKTKKHKRLRQQQLVERTAYEAERRNRAAIVIQKQWKKYCLLKQYHAMHYRPISTNPVILPHRQTHSSTEQHSYQRRTLVSDIPPQRKLTRTMPSGFFVARKIPAPNFEVDKPPALPSRLSTASLLSNMAKKKEVKKKSLSQSTTTSRLPKPMQTTDIILPPLQHQLQSDRKQNSSISAQEPTLHLPPIV